MTIQLAPLGLKYLETTHSFAIDLENTRYMLRLPNETIDETKSFLEGAENEWKKTVPEFYEYAILLDGIHIGAVSAYPDEERRTAELGWILDKKYWGKGYGYEAARQVVEFCKNELGIHQFIAHCDSENIASYRIMEKLGMRRACVNERRKNRSSEELRLEYQYEM